MRRTEKRQSRKQRRSPTNEVELLKNQCMEDFRRLKTSFERLLAAGGADEVLRFAMALYTMDKMNLRMPW